MSDSRYTLHSLSQVLPLGRPYGAVEPSSAQPSERRPFGLRFARACTAISTVDIEAIAYDEKRQISIVETPEGVIPLARHTDGQTSTVTHGDGKGGHDTDTDHRED